MKIHHVLMHDFIGRDQMETLCNRLVRVQRGTDDRPTIFTTEKGTVFNCVMDPRDVTCNTCQHVWRNIK